MFTAITPEKRAAHESATNCFAFKPTDTGVGSMGKPSSPMRKAIAKAITWRVIGTAEIFAISFWTTGHIATAGHTAGIAAITSIVMYVAHELAWHEGGWWYSDPGIAMTPARTEADEAAA